MPKSNSYMIKTRLRMVSVILFLLGLALIIFSVYPLLEYEYVARKRFPKLVSPMSAPERYLTLLTPQKDYREIQDISSEYEIKIGGEELTEYRLSIPKLKIYDAKVFEGGEDLSKSLIQYPGTAQPGQIGNAVVFGHSVLPVFFNPKNYLSIFSTIPKLRLEDEIIVNMGNVKYKYRVVSMFEVEPDNLEILDQRVDNSYLSLVTCVPPGHPLKPRRLVVKGILTND